MKGVDEFTREDIEDLLAALGAKLQARGVAATVYVVGGAAIALRNVSSQRRTADVDALMVPEEQVLEAAREVAAERGLRSTWLNSAVRPYVPPLYEALQPPGAPGLEVRTAPDEHLLAMKIVAARGQRDMRDIMFTYAADQLRRQNPPLPGTARWSMLRRSPRWCGSPAVGTFRPSSSIVACTARRPPRLPADSWPNSPWFQSLPQTQSGHRLSRSRSRNRCVFSAWVPLPHGSSAPQPLHGTMDEQNT